MEIIIMKFEYQEKPKINLKSDFDRRVRNNENSFKDFSDFFDWYTSQIKVCHYCGLKEEESQKIVVTGLLTSNRFPQKGKRRRGQSRGVWLEVDRLNPKQKYSRDNCKLCCYFCNNDKSDVFYGKEYKEFMEHRVQYLRNLIQES